MKILHSSQWRLLLQWMKAHPIKACGFTCFWTLLCATMAACPSIVIPLLVVAVAATAVLLWVMARDLRRVIGFVLAFVMLTQGGPVIAEEKKPEPLPVGPTIVVLVVAGVIIYYIIRLCQRRFTPPPPPVNTNNPPIGIVAADGLPNDYAATMTFTYYESCPIDPASLMPIIEMRINGSFVQTTNGLELRLDAQPVPEPELVDPGTFGRLLAAHGVQVGNGPGQAYFGRNGQPATQAEVPIYFWQEDNDRNFSFTPAGDPVSIVFERSPDLVHWTRFGNATVSAGQRMEIHDATASAQMFYRFRPQ